VRRLFKQGNEQGSFLDAAAPPKEINETIQVDGLTVGGIKVAVTEAEVYVQQVQILPPYFLDKLGDVLKALVARYESTNLPIRLTLLNIEQFGGFPEEFGFHIVDDESVDDAVDHDPAAVRKFVDYARPMRCLDSPRPDAG